MTPRHMSSPLVTTLGSLVILVLATGNEAAVCTPTPTTPEVECLSPQDCEGLYHELCIEGGWQCVANECQYQCEPVQSTCPTEPPIGVDGICASGLECEYGQECCCGECHPSLVCNCMGGQWGCYYTDACLIPFCPCSSNSDCNDWDPCTEDLCDAATGQCLHKEKEGCCTEDGDCQKGSSCQIMVCPGCYCEDPTDPESCPPCLCWGECVPDQPADCVVSGCSGEICASEPMGSFCIWLAWYECLTLTECGAFGQDGACAWKGTEAFEDCVESTPCQGVAGCPAGFTCTAGECAPVETEECVDLCDCYDLYGMEFEGVCPLMCPMCGNFWECASGQCTEQCGVIPMERQDCFPVD